MPAILDHIHTLIRYDKFFGRQYYRCANPDCLFKAPTSLLLGKRSLCAICEKNELILNWKHFKLAKPRCDKCSQTKEAINKRKIKALMESILEVDKKMEKSDASR